MSDKGDIWEQHPEFRKRYDEIHAFCQSNSFTEYDSYEMMAEFEDKKFGKLQNELLKREDEIKGVLNAINFTYTYLRSLRHKEALENKTELT
jgi:hypothetical protein